MELDERNQLEWEIKKAESFFKINYGQLTASPKTSQESSIANARIVREVETTTDHLIITSRMDIMENIVVVAHIHKVIQKIRLARPKHKPLSQ